MSVEVSAAGMRRPAWSDGLARYCRAVCARIGAGAWEVSVLLCDDETIAELNHTYRGKRGPTDVLSFRQEDRITPGDKKAVGDIVISVPTVRRNARSSGVTMEEELKRVATHGILHLAGMNHGPGRGGEMLALQEAILHAFCGRRIAGAPRRR